MRLRIMEVSLHTHHLPVAIAVLKGRLDAHGTSLATQQLTAQVPTTATFLVFDFTEVGYLSSAGLRLLLVWHKRLLVQNGGVVLCGLSEYCAEVLTIAGFAGQMPAFVTRSKALAHCGVQAAERVELPCGAFVVHPGGTVPGFVDVVGDIEDVLASRVTPAHLCSKPFSAKAFSIGLGGLGAKLDDYFGIMGEMITIGGTMVWLPTDGHDTPDFLIPKSDGASVLLRTGFNASLEGDFHEVMEFTAARPEGAAMNEIYRSLCDYARGRRPDYRGAIGLAMVADVSALYGCGVVKSPVASNAPENGKWITHPDNYPAWFESDHEPKRRDLTGLITGIGVDLDADLNAFDQGPFKASFYLNPGNVPAHRVQLHNHGVFFSRLPFPQTTALDAAITEVVDQGDFIDMRHLLDRTAVTRALIGVIYVTDFRRDTSWQGQ